MGMYFLLMAPNACCLALMEKCVVLSTPLVTQLSIIAALPFVFLELKGLSFILLIILQIYKTKDYFNLYYFIFFLFF